VDFEDTELDVVVEVSGRLGHTSDRDRQRDARRRNALQADGLLVIEFTTADVLDDAPYVIRTLKPELAARSCRPLITEAVL
jgi:very-short-patch-repair endonuclease